MVSTGIITISDDDERAARRRGGGAEVEEETVPVVTHSVWPKSPNPREHLKRMHGAWSVTYTALRCRPWVAGFRAVGVHSAQTAEAPQTARLFAFRVRRGRDTRGSPRVDVDDVIKTKVKPCRVSYCSNDPVRALAADLRFSA